MLVFMFFISWKRHPTKIEIYGNYLFVYAKPVKARLVQFAGHCYRAENEIISTLLLWKPIRNSRDRSISYPDMIARDTGFQREDLYNMMDLGVWRNVVNSIVSTTVEQ